MAGRRDPVDVRPIGPPPGRRRPKARRPKTNRPRHAVTPDSLDVPPRATNRRSGVSQARREPQIPSDSAARRSSPAYERSNRRPLEQATDSRCDACGTARGGSAISKHGNRPDNARVKAVCSAVRNEGRLAGPQSGRAPVSQGPTREASGPGGCLVGDLRAGRDRLEEGPPADQRDLLACGVEEQGDVTGPLLAPGGIPDATLAEDEGGPSRSGPARSARDRARSWGRSTCA